MLISDATYLNWQKRLAQNAGFRRFWKFWAIYCVFLIFIVGGYFLLIDKWQIVLLAFAAFILARVIIAPLIYLVYKKERPYQELNFTPIHSWLFSEPTVRHNSFPSDHAASFGAIVLVFFWYTPAWGAALLLIAIMNGLARIVLGYHYPMHVLAGWVVGVISALGVIFWLAPRVFTL